ncbi:ABC transporter ATP-binding protein [Clostridium sp. 'White wine YQ']|uniref:ABC transporter ATP-binding protein n=1 Tax=Clostridium sp. 'White wine YQ' TaxID=3027474 RepID=UPI002366F620|nr:ABC transporter ATP-binding protein [Clostridium sp. 'White wine YQ']MDD7795913.1 ABC transporter ATP-binding protein [Clostridium sp. 'White wine YQ']
MSLIRLIDVNKKYDFTKALDNINLTIEKGELVAIMGPSGSGKSTLLNILGCIDVPTSGKYQLDDEVVSTFSSKKLANIRNKKIGYIFQNFNLLNDYNLVENVSIPLIYSQKKDKHIKNSAIDFLKKVGLGKHITKTPNELSGGQKQRVAIARALVNNPEIILADEPTGSLDQKTGLLIMDMLKDINSQGYTVIIVTHDVNIANQCDRKIIINDGKILE